MDLKRKLVSIPALVGMAICMLSAVPVVASDSATVSLVAEGVDERVVLTVSGPGDLTYEKTFAAGSTPSFELFDATGNSYPDGSYTWELRAAPAKATKTRDQDDRGLGKRARSEVLASGYFTIRDGGFVPPDLTEEVRPKNTDVPTKDQVILDDLIVDGSLCVGFDCVNGESFGFDTIRMKENNLRIRAYDTSSTASFPSNDWQITFNDTASGGANKFSIDDIDGGRTPFTIEASAPSHSLYVDDGGRLGFGTSTPVADLHVKSGNTPTLRLEQDGSSGFTAQTWDVAGNEANFFIRDATNGSELPFRIIPGAPSNSIYVASDGDVGLGAGTSPSAPLHVKRTNGTAQVLIEETSAANMNMILLYANGRPKMIFNDTSDAATDSDWVVGIGTLNRWMINANGDTDSEFTVDTSGNVEITGTLKTAGTCSGGACDRVFSSEYELESIEDHAAAMWENSHLPAVGPTPEDGPFNLSVMTGGLLNELEKAHIYIEQLHDTIKRLEERVAQIESEK